MRAGARRAERTPRPGPRKPPEDGAPEPFGTGPCASRDRCSARLRRRRSRRAGRGRPGAPITAIFRRPSPRTGSKRTLRGHRPRPARLAEQRRVHARRHARSSRPRRGSRPAGRRDDRRRHRLGGQPGRLPGSVRRLRRGLRIAHPVTGVPGPIAGNPTGNAEPHQWRPGSTPPRIARGRPASPAARRRVRGRATEGRGGAAADRHRVQPAPAGTTAAGTGRRPSRGRFLEPVHDRQDRPSAMRTLPPRRPRWRLSRGGRNRRRVLDTRRRDSSRDHTTARGDLAEGGRA